MKKEEKREGAKETERGGTERGEGKENQVTAWQKWQGHIGIRSWRREAKLMG